jgi:GDP-L-fucose synthase
MTLPACFDLAQRRVFVAGHRGMVGAALVRRLSKVNCTVLTAPWPGIDLRNQAQVDSWIANELPDVVIVAAGKVGGIAANRSEPGTFLYDNMMIAANVIEASRRHGVGKLLYIASSAVYPYGAPQPLHEDVLFSGPPDPSHSGYAMAKLAGIKLVQTYRQEYGCDFIAALPTNLYGPGDKFNLQSSHVVPGLLRRMHEAKVEGASEIEVWGTGQARREFLHVEDLADACLVLLNNYSDDVPINVGCGYDVSITELSESLALVTGFGGVIRYDAEKPEGVPRRLMDSSRLFGLGWKPQIDLMSGLRLLYVWYAHAQAAMVEKR